MVPPTAHDMIRAMRVAHGLPEPDLTSDQIDASTGGGPTEGRLSRLVGRALTLLVTFHDRPVLKPTQPRRGNRAAEHLG